MNIIDCLRTSTFTSVVVIEYVWTRYALRYLSVP